MKPARSLAETWRERDHAARLTWMTSGRIAEGYEVHQGDLIRWTYSTTADRPTMKIIAEEGEQGSNRKETP